MRYVTTALVVAVLILSVQLHSAKDRIAVLEQSTGGGIGERSFGLLSEP